MEMLPESTWEIVNQLEELSATNYIFGSSRREEEIVRLLKQLENAGHPRTIRCVAKFVMERSQNVRNLAKQVIGKLTLNIPPHDLTNLAHYLSWACDFESLKPANVSELAGSPIDDGYCGVLGIMSFHHNGYIRQEAVCHLSNIFDGTELPFLIFRQNDWVHAIAQEAQQAVSQRINDSYARHFYRCLRLIVHSELLGRYDHRAMLRRVFELFCVPQHDELLRSAISSSDRDVRHRVVRHVFEQSGEHQLRVLIFANTSSDPLVRELCAKHLHIIGNTYLFLNIQEELAEDRFMSVRRAAIEQKAIRFPEKAQEQWIESLFDLSRSIRELARFMLKEFDIGETDVAALYRAKLEQQPELFPALESLSEVGGIADETILRAHLTHKYPTRRAAAIRGLARIHKDAFIPNLLPFLNDPSPCVVRAVLIAVGSGAYLLDGNELESVAIHASAYFSRKTAIDMIYASGKWKSIPHLLSIASHAEQATAEYAERTLLRWFIQPESTRIFTRPSQKNTADIKSKLSEAAGNIPESTLSLVRKELAFFSR